MSASAPIQARAVPTAPNPSSPNPSSPNPSSPRQGKALGRNVLFALLGNALSPIAALASAPILAQALGVDARGQVAAATAPLLLATALATFGVPAAVTHFVARRSALARIMMRRGVVVLLLAGAAASAATLVASGYLSGGSESLRGLILLASLALVPTLFVGLLRAVAAGFHAWRTVTMAQGITSAFRLVALAALWGSDRLDVTAAVVVIAVAPVVGGVAFLPLLRRGEAGGHIGGQVDREAGGEVDSGGAPSFRRVGSYGLRVWFGSIAGMLLLRLDQTLMAPLGGVEQLGLYVVAASIAEIPLVVTNAVRDVVFSADSARSDDERLVKVSRIMTAATALVAVIAAAVTPFLLPLLFGAEFGGALPACLLLLVSTVVGNSLAGISLSSRGRPGLRSGALVAACLVNVALLIILVPVMGAFGAALATLVAGFVSGAINVANFSRIHHVSPIAFVGLRRGDFELIGAAARAVGGRLRGRLRASAPVEGGAGA